MTSDQIVALISGEETGHAWGVSWIPAAERDEPPLADAVRPLVADIAFVDASAPRACADVCDLQLAGSTAVWAVSGPVGRVAQELGWAAVLRASAHPSGGTSEQLQRACADAEAAIRAGAEAGARIVLIADDLAGASGWLFAPEFVGDSVVPLIGCLARYAAGLGMVVAFHSDGDIRELYPRLAREGFSAVHVAVPSLKATTELVDAARAAGLVPLGGVPATLLLQGDRGRIEQAVRTMIAGGPLVVCDDGGMTSTAELTTLAELYAELRATT